MGPPAEPPWDYAGLFVIEPDFPFASEVKLTESIHAHTYYIIHKFQWLKQN